MPKRNIRELMHVAEHARDLKWLQESLANAVQLELSTLPPYLCAYWSITPQSDQTAAGLIYDIFMQEMKHMGLSANMLVGIGGTPEINSAVPKYPGRLPGGVMPWLRVYLAGITPGYVKNICMAIETPDDPHPAVTETYPTIGAFYDAIASAFESMKPETKLATELQQTSSVGVVEIPTVADALRAINTIKVEGEGTSTSPDESPGDPAHYYKFGSIYYGKTVIKKDDHWTWEGTAVPFPAAYPMAEVPDGGWTNAPNVPANVLLLLNTFNKKYKEVLDGLQGAWTGKNTLGNAIHSMYALASPAQSLMQIAIGGSAGNYGPDFIV